MDAVDENRAQLHRYREAIDACDAELVRILARRFAVTERVGQLKMRAGWPAVDERREAEQAQHIAVLAREQGLDPEVALAVWRTIVDLVVQRHREE
ncbi:MAG: chorismate mutase [Actinomycetaceae bacterium]|nr:chorismate mutase [Actinomycetaceae bacterium]MDY5855286.1 chorismate mutase [Arcanobacterium sp.]